LFKCTRLCGVQIEAHPTRVIGSENQRPWPADKVERWSIDRLIPYTKNARTHSDAQIAAIAASIKEWGWTTPALVGEDGGLIAGHARDTRRPAARHRRNPRDGRCGLERGAEAGVRPFVLAHLTPTQRRAFADSSR
jgi:hypothetical protein